MLVLNIGGLLFQLLDILKISQIYESMQNWMSYKLMKKYFWYSICDQYIWSKYWSRTNRLKCDHIQYFTFFWPYTDFIEKRQIYRFVEQLNLYRFVYGSILLEKQIKEKSWKYYCGITPILMKNRWKMASPSSIPF